MVRACCKGCIHHRKISTAGGMACHFAIDMGRLRGCAPEECKYYDSDKSKLKEMRRKNKEYDLATAFGTGGTGYYDD